MDSKNKNGESIKVVINSQCLVGIEHYYVRNEELRKNMENFEFTFEGEVCTRLDVVLTEKTGISRSKIKKDILDGNVRVNNKVSSKVSSELKSGDTIKIKITEEKTSNLIPQKGHLNVVFEDDDILVINKDFHITVHPGIGNHDNTLSNYVYEYLGKYPFLVHRLDKDTSGLIVIAKTEENLIKLQKQWIDRKVKKFYKALVCGKLDSKEGIIDSPIKRDSKNRKEMTVSIQETAKNARTKFKVDKVFDDSVLVNVQIFTGRTHQIRVHFKAIGNPVVGDVVYGDKKINKIYKNQYGLERQFLHASKIEFTHPKTEKVLKFEIDLAEDLQEVVNKLCVSSRT